MAAKVFTGANVLMSRNLVPPELFDALHDALKLNGAQVFLCCDPSRNGPSDYHVIASSDHEKFESLRSKGCKLIGPQCVLSCAKEHRVLPIQGFTCCLAMDGVNILLSGFDKDEKAEMTMMVTAMGGLLHAKASSDVNFVIVKNVLAPRYKWALNNLKKPILTANWLRQCWKEHRVVPQEAYRVLAFSGLIICVSGIPADERKEIEKLVLQNAGRYSAELTRKCTHLICDAPEGDKYQVAKRWGHICIVTRKWFHQSIARRACLSEESYPVQASSASSMSTIKTMGQHSQGKGIRSSQHTSSSMPTVSDMDSTFSAQDTEPDLEIPLPNIYPTLFEAPPLPVEGNDAPTDKHKNDSSCDRCVADDSQSEDDDLYLSECRILLVGFDASELRKLVDMVRRGGGSRYMSFSEKLTHVLVGHPSETEVKELRSLASLGVIYVVKTIWLEECTQKKKEIPVLQHHIAYDVLLPKDPVTFNKTNAINMSGMKQGKSSTSQAVNINIRESKISQPELLPDLKQEAKVRVQSGMCNGSTKLKSSTVFTGMCFGFSSSFPREQRPEVVSWVNQGGGEVIADQNQKKTVDFTIERHGVMPCPNTFGSTYVTSHWIYSCLEDGCLLDVSSHILYSPLSCQIPLPGFGGYRLCVSQYSMKERHLLRNLCYVLGAKFIEKLTKKATHLLCKFADGDKYEAARRWGIPVVTAQWIYECAKQNKLVDLKGFFPKEPTSQDREAGLCVVSQYPTQSAKTTSEDDAPQHSNLFQDQENTQSTSIGSLARDNNNAESRSKRARLSGFDNTKHPLTCVSAPEVPLYKSPTETSLTDNTTEIPAMVPDVAAAIEELLEQTSKIQDRESPESRGCHESFLSSNSSMIGQRFMNPLSDPGPTKHWINRLDKKDERLDKKDEAPTADVPARGTYDGFSEPTDSQVVGYEEDLSGMQMIIERVRARSNMR